MKILHLVQMPQLRGAEIFASQQAIHMVSMGHKAVMVFLFPGKAELPFTGKTYNLNGNKSNRLKDIKAWRTLARIIKEEKPDIIQANAGDTLKYAVLSKLIFRWKQPVVFRNASTISLYIKTSAARKFNSFFFRYADKIISVSNSSADDFCRLFPEYKNKVVTVPIGIENNDLEDSDGPVINESFKRSGPVLLHVGGFSFEKNHIGLIRIFEKVLKLNPAASLHLVGNGPLKEEIEDLVRQKGLEANVQFYGFQKNAMQFMRSADVLLLPSIIEGLPGVILEAFYCKIPVVAYDVGGIKEILLNNRTGRLIHKNDESAFIDGVVNALVKTPDNQKLIQNAHRLVIAQYLNARVAKEFLNLYKTMLANKHNYQLVW